MKIDIKQSEWETILNKLNIKIERKGNDKIFCLCPFHDDKNPSMVIYTKSNFFKCYSLSCHKKGDVIELVSLKKFNRESGKFKESILFLSEIVGSLKVENYLKKFDSQGTYNELFKSWTSSNLLVKIDEVKFLKGIEEDIKEIRVVPPESWCLIESFTKTFSFSTKVYKEDLLLIDFNNLGYYVYSKTGDLIAKINNKYNIYKIFEENNGSYHISGNIFNIEYKGELEKAVTSSFYTENPLIYCLLKKDFRIGIGILSQESEFNFFDDFFIYCFMILENGKTNVSDRVKGLFEWFLDDNNVNWFYKLVNIRDKDTKQIYECIKQKDKILKS